MGESDDGLPPLLESWVESAEGSDFSMQNLPYGVFSCSKATRKRCGVAIGAFVLDLKETCELFSRLEILADGDIFDASIALRCNNLNGLMECGLPVWQAMVFSPHHEQAIPVLFRKCALFYPPGVRP